MLQPGRHVGVPIFTPLDCAAYSAAPRSGVLLLGVVEVMPWMAASEVPAVIDYLEASNRSLIGMVYRKRCRARQRMTAMSWGIFCKASRNMTC